ncbi:MAG: ABC transporter permease [Candidatus Aminicenantes bacterium]|nr:ABC transporter permease [Candidatus Aminicenantes bacterium]MDH5386046.1 ABC transporter permease [Candidatus Aminicenantes bacterium]
MLKNYFKVTLRNIKEQKGYSLINIASLAIGLSCSIMILLFVKYEFSYDKYHENALHIYRVLREHQGDTTWSNSSEHPLAASLKEDFPEVIKSTRVKKNDEVGVVEYGAKRFYEEGIFFADQDFLEIFSFPLNSGEMSTALKEPFSALLTQEMTEKYFGNEDPIGKIIQIKEWYSVKKYDYKIRGVLKNIPKNSHFTFDFLLSYNTMYSLKRGGKDSVETWSYYEPKTYVKLNPHTEPKGLEGKFPAFLKKYKGEDSESEKMHLQPLTDIHLGGNMRFELETNSDMRLIYMFSAIAFFILIIACLNYINLSVARSAKRAVEVGMRKVAGANKSQLVRQFLGESLIFSILALLISLLAVDLVLPVFSSMIERDLTLNLFHNLDLLLIFLSITIFAGLLSGSYPAFLVSSFQPIQIIKGTLIIGTKSSAVFRNSLVVVQFVVSIILLVCTFVIHNQLNYIRNRDLGFDKEQIVTFYTMDMNLKRNPEPFKKELLKNPDILGITASLDLPTTIRRSSTVEWDSQGERRTSEMNFTFVDYDFFNVYDIKIEKGRNFSAEFPIDKKQAVVLNETAARNLGWDDPVGRRLFVQGQEWTIIGVTKDFNFQSLHWRIDPLVFVFYESRGMDYFSVKVNPSNIPRALAFIEEKWKTFSPEFPFQPGFLDERIDKIYKAEQRLGESFTIFTFLALSIACLGLFGLASFLLEQKRKEISIRKILGADFQNIIVLLAKEYMKCLALAAVIAWPIGYFVMSRWLQNFVYKTGIGIEIFILSGLLAFVFALCTVSYQSIKAAVANPVDSLRYE